MSEPLTEFEKQVEDALWDACQRAKVKSYADEIVRVLAPRVAEAIQAAAWDKTDPPWAVSRVRCQAALAALRGDAP